MNVLIRGRCCLSWRGAVHRPFSQFVFKLMYGCGFALTMFPALSIAESGNTTSSLSPAASQRESRPLLGMHQAVELALARHPSIQGSRALVEQAQAQVHVAESARWPVITYGVAPGYDPNQGRNSNVQFQAGVNQTLYDFGVSSGSISGSEARLDKQHFIVADTAEKVARQVSELYVEMAAAQEMVGAADREAEAIKTVLNRIDLRVKAGLADVSDLKRAHVSRERAVADRLQAETRYQVAADQLERIIGTPVPVVIDLKNVYEQLTHLGPPSQNVDAAPGLMAARSSVVAAESDVQVAQGKRYPSLGVGVTRISSMLGGEVYNTTQMGLVMKGSIETGNAGGYQVASARAARQAAEHEVASQRLAVETSLSSAERNLAGAQSRVTAYERMMQLWAESRELYWQEYVLNKRSLSEVLNIERDIYQADADRIDAVKQVMIAMIESHAATGSLINRLRESGTSRL